jgi:hypothetical protein
MVEVHLLWRIAQAAVGAWFPPLPCVRRGPGSARRSWPSRGWRGRHRGTGPTRLETASARACPDPRLPRPRPDAAVPVSRSRSDLRGPPVRPRYAPPHARARRQTATSG